MLDCKYFIDIIELGIDRKFIMQIASTFNNSIRILFNPRIESFKLFDFLIVKSDDLRYIAQIVEIYDDKFDASQNVAKLKLFYQLNQNNEVIPYDNFTPNKECEISKIKQEEIETFTNQDKETFILGTNVRTTSALNVQFDFFEKNAVILADKIENANAITFNLAKKLSTKKNSVIIDTTGVLELDGAKKIKACEDFKMPLNYTTIDTVFDRCLSDASLEFQTIGGQIINEIKKFAQTQESNFLPFNALSNVLMQQHKATPYPELELLLVRLKKYQMNKIFANTKMDKEALFCAIENNSITIIDLSDIDAYWQKAYMEYIISDIEQEIYLITRINEEHFDVDLINKVYNKKKNIKFIPNVSYNYKKLPSVMQHCKNYILMPSLTQRTDFLDANFALCNLIMDGCIIFGENTDNFIYLVRDYELEIQEKRKNYRKMALSMVQQEENKKQDYDSIDEYDEIEEKKLESNDLIEELSDFDANQQETLENEEEYSLSETKQDENFNEIENPVTLNSEEDVFQDLILEQKNDENIEIKSETEDEFQNIEIEENITKKEINENVNIETNEISDNESNILSSKETLNASMETTDIQKDVSENTNEATQVEEMSLSDDELDFFQIAQDNVDEVEKEEIKNNSEDDIDLNEIADNSIDNNFEEIINSKNPQTKNTIAVDEKIEINEEIINQTTEKENLPIFKDEKKEEKPLQAYTMGNVITHKKYGKGTIIKTIKYEDRQLLQIDFEETGKKLLDPTVADIKLEQ